MNEDESLQIVLFASDVDGSDNLTFSVTSAPVELDADIIDVNILSIIPYQNYNSPSPGDLITVTVTDNTSLTDTQTLTITVTNVIFYSRKK